MAVLASGGIDSACLLEWARQRTRGAVYPVYVSFGLRWENCERKALRAYLRAIEKPLEKFKGLIENPVVLSMPARDLYGGHWSMTGRGVPGARSSDSAVYLPGRNLMMLSKAFVFCAKFKIEHVAIGTLAANPFQDASPKFLSAFSNVASIALGCNLQVIAPFRHLTKTELVKRYSHLPLHLCFSCLQPGKSSGKPCGRCNKCVEWRRVLSRQ